MKTAQEAATLIYKFLEDTLDDDERRQLLEWISANEGNQRLFYELVSVENRKAILERHSNVKDELFLAITKSANRKKSPMVLYLAAAAVIGAILISVFFYRTWRVDKESAYKPRNVDSIVASFGTDLVEDGVYILHDRKKWKLDTVPVEIATIGITADQSKIVVDKGIAQADNDVLIKVGRGKICFVTLPDSSLVVLNGMSTLLINKNFLKKRVVELSGEGFFEIAKVLQSGFDVRTPDRQIVHVLGTKFNISAYHSEKTETTVTEGVVGVSIGDSSIKLTKGNQAVLLSDTWEVKPVNDAIASAWILNKIDFTGRSLPWLFERISRAYDVKVKVRMSKVELERKIQGTLPTDIPVEVLVEALKVLFAKVATVQYSHGEITIVEAQNHGKKNSH